MNRTTTIFVALLAILGISLWLLIREDRPNELGNDPLLVHCAAGLRIPVSEIAKQYEEEFGVAIHLQFGGSGALESQLEIAGGDLYLPADVSYIESTRAKGLIREAIPVAKLTAGIVVPKGNPKNLRSLDDLSKPGIRLSLADPSAAIGKFTRSVLQKSGHLPRIEPNVVVTKPTVNNIVEDVATAAVDATIAWDATAHTFPDLEFIAVPEFNARPKTNTIGILHASTQPTRALHFARFLSSRDRGQPVFAKAGFALTPTADRWADIPEVTLFSGSMLRPAIQERIRAFEAREGCRIKTIFEGCGTLVAMMESTNDTPGAYFSCDTKFLDMVADRFGPETVVSENRIILLVAKGNPKQLKGLSDLTNPNLKLGLCDPEKSALGDLTHQMLKRHQLLSPLEASGNIAVLASKGDELVNAMQTNSLDGALLYHSNALASPEIGKTCDIIPLDDPLAIATQPFAIAKETDYAHLMARLGTWLSEPSSRQRFEDLGFTWKLPEQE